MRKLKVYLDTSVISYLDQDDAPEKRRETQALWKRFEQGEFEVFLSQVALKEIGRCSEPKRHILYDYLDNIAFKTLEVDDESLKLTQRIIDLGILPQRKFDDSQHLAIAVVHGCDVLLSWNFKDMVNVRTIRGIRAVTNLGGYKGIDIASPSALLASEDEYE